MTITWWIIFSILSLSINLIATFFIFNSYWAFLVLTVFELGFFIYRQHQIGIYEKGLIAISPKKLFRTHSENFDKQIQSGLEKKTKKNESDLDKALSHLNKYYDNSLKNYQHLTNEITKVLNKSDKIIEKNLEKKITQYQDSLKEEQNKLKKASVEIFNTQKKLEKLTVFDQKSANKKIKQFTTRLNYELDTPNQHVDKRVLPEFDILTQKIDKFKKDLEKRLDIRHKKQF